MSITWRRRYVANGNNDNMYGRPLEGLDVLVDIGRREVVRFRDTGGPPVPPRDDPVTDNRWYLPADQERTTLKALHITMPDGPSFEISHGNLVEWQVSTPCRFTSFFL